MKHRLYKLESKFTILGMGWFDWCVILGSFMFGIQFLGALAHPKLQLVIGLLTTAFVYWAWHLVKDKVPDKFPEHFIGWIGEPEVYRCVPDTQNVPLVVDFTQVRAAKSREPQMQQGGEPRGTFTFEG